MDRGVIPNSEAVVVVSGLSKNVRMQDDTHGSLPILRDIAFSVLAGQTVAIVGASGSGKSTLLGLIAGLDVPTAGSVQLCGQSLFELDEDARARLRGEQMGFVFQSFQLLPALTALDNVMLPLELAGQKSAETTARHWLGQVGLGERVNHYPKHLSGGEQQRVALARAFAVSPAVLLADEPTGNLDAQTGAAIIDLMFSLNRANGTTLILVTHDDALAERCDRILHMSAGMLEERVRSTST